MPKENPTRTMTTRHEHLNEGKEGEEKREKGEKNEKRLI